jgi:hypothetical protein
MRIIPDEALDFIAGGYGDASKSIPVVTVPGPYDPGHDPGPGPVDPGHPAVSSPEPPRDCTVVHSSPVPSDAPKDVDMNKLRNTMLDVASLIKGFDSGIEHGAIVVRSADGALRVGEMAHGSADNIAIAATLYSGDKIVGYIHSHPADTINQTLPSRYDFDQAEGLRGKPYVDKGMMLYILDNASGDVFEYHAGTPRNTTRNGPNITDDTSQPCH